MKAGKILLAAAFALTLAASANAGIHVWWEMADASAGAQGQTLNLDCAAGARCEWDLTMYIGQDSESDGILAWAEDLHIAPGLGSTVTVKNNEIAYGMPWNTVQDAGVANGGNGVGGFYHLLEGAQGQLAGYIYGPLTTAVLNVTLSVNAAPAGVIDIMSEGGYTLWIAKDSSGMTYPYVDFFGAQDSVYGSYGAIRSNAAISINVVPEPTTVAFLGLGALALIRRRR